MPQGSEPEDPAAVLLRRWQSDGDLEALDELLRVEVTMLAERVRSRGAGMLSASQSASDVAQDAVLRLLRKEELPQFSEPRQFRAYLWKCAWRLLLDRLEAANRRPERLSETRLLSPESHYATTGGILAFEDAEETLALEVSLQLLDPEDRDILDYVYFQHLSIEETARRLGIERSAADMRLTRARRRLAKKLSGWARVIRD